MTDPRMNATMNHLVQSQQAEDLPVEPSAAPAADFAGEPDPELGALNELAEVALDLIDALDAETAILQTLKLDEAEPRMARKRQLADLYALKSEALKNRLNERRIILSDDLREGLVHLNDRLREAAQENAVALKAAMDGTKVVIEVISQAVKKQQSMTTYGRSGRATETLTGGTPGLAMFSDRRL